jgi:DNA-binding PadR family transcriptional regulator
MASVSAEKTRWMRGPSTPLRGALLGLLLERPGHGGDLANRLAGRLGDTWRVDTNDVYRLLEQLEGSGLAVSREEPKRSDSRRTHLVYHATSAAAQALTLWMETLLPREPVRLGLQAKLSVARAQDAPRLLVALRAYEHECLALARRVRPGEPEPRSWAGLCTGCSRDGVLGQLHSDVEWARRTTGRIEQFLGRSDEAPGTGEQSRSRSRKSSS